ncbi:hypothetical protein BS50DRAFT_635829 [Corynespora cassiicola Philippines]|uniref:RING-type domain-containing protein n=1 Tax=Corynespora cassiicola Philippines TaxID=1448308 RepID=A0A2T2NHT9_CORCC|nr:hypothetical protein BS50DRAFT_635829 [Corynespora cassiicola Philippines]
MDDASIGTEGHARILIWEPEAVLQVNPEHCFHDIGDSAEADSIRQCRSILHPSNNDALCRLFTNMAYEYPENLSRSDLYMIAYIGTCPMYKSNRERFDMFANRLWSRFLQWRNRMDAALQVHLASPVQSPATLTEAAMRSNHRCSPEPEIPIRANNRTRSRSRFPSQCDEDDEHRHDHVNVSDDRSIRSEETESLDISVASNISAHEPGPEHVTFNELYAILLTNWLNQTPEVIHLGDPEEHYERSNSHHEIESQNGENGVEHDAVSEAETEPLVELEHGNASTSRPSNLSDDRIILSLEVHSPSPEEQSQSHEYNESSESIPDRKTVWKQNEVDDQLWQYLYHYYVEKLEQARTVQSEETAWEKEGLLLLQKARYFYYEEIAKVFKYPDDSAFARRDAMIVAKTPDTSTEGLFEKFQEAMSLLKRLPVAYRNIEITFDSENRMKAKKIYKPWPREAEHKDIMRELSLRTPRFPKQYEVAEAKVEEIGAESALDILRQIHSTHWIEAEARSHYFKVMIEISERCEKHVPRKPLDKHCIFCTIELDGTDYHKLNWCKEQCGKSFHRDCLLEWGRVKLGRNALSTCPNCRADMHSCYHDVLPPHPKFNDNLEHS